MYLPDIFPPLPKCLLCTYYVILTSTCNDTYFLQTAVGACESRKRCREDTDEITDGSEASKRPCRYLL